MASRKLRDAEQAVKILENGFIQLERCWNAEEIGREYKEERKRIIITDLEEFFKQKIEEERHNLIKQKILNVRNELVHWWDKCFFNTDERMEFEEFTSENFSQHMLDRHLDEVQTLKKYYNTNKTILELVRKHQEMWQRVMDVENQQYNPDRLFQNRGAQLLQEERDRKTAQKDLPRLEEQIKKLTEAYERQNRRPFLVYGKRFSETIVIQKENHKENQKALRSARKCASHNEIPSAAKTAKKTAPSIVAKQAPKTVPKPPSMSSVVLQRTGSKTAPKRKLSHSSTPTSAPNHKIAKVNGLQQTIRTEHQSSIRPKKTVRRKLLERNINTQRDGCSSFQPSFQPLPQVPFNFIKQEPSSFIKQEYSYSFQQDSYNSIKQEPFVFVKKEPTN